MESQTIARTLARFIHGISYEKLPSEVAHRAKSLILDALGTAIAGWNLPYSLVALKLAEGSQGNATIFMHHRKATAADAAFINAVLAGGIAQDDVLYTFHPGMVNVPAAIAVAEQEGSSGTELITALVVGYDVMGRIFLGGTNIRLGFRDGSVFTSFGTAGAAGKLFKLNEDQLTSALELAANFSSGLRQWAVSGTKERDFFDPFAARNGIIAAALSREGVIAADETLEGERGFYQAFTGTNEQAGLAVKDLGKRFLIMEAKYKPYPVCWISVMPIALALRLAAKYNVNSRDISEIIVTLPYADAVHAGTDFTGPFVRSSQAVLSTQFAVAAAFLGKPVTSYKLYFNHHDDPEILELARRIKIIGEKDRVIQKINVILHDANEYTIEEDVQEELVPNDEQVQAKFIELASGIIGQERAAEIISIVSNLDKLNSVRELTQKLS